MPTTSQVTKKKASPHRFDNRNPKNDEQISGFRFMISSTLPGNEKVKRELPEAGGRVAP